MDTWYRMRIVIKKQFIFIQQWHHRSIWIGFTNVEARSELPRIKISMQLSELNIVKP